MSRAARPLPAATPASAEYWAGCRRHELLIQRCRDCGGHQFYPRILCAACHGRSLDWVRASGRGTVRSYTIVRRPISEAFSEDVPYVVALVALAEGPTMMSWVVDCPPEKLRVGLAVAVAFDDRPEGVTLPVFRPAQAR